MIPRHWQTFEVQQIAKIIRGASPRPKGDPKYYGGNIPRLMVADVTRDKKYITPSIDFLTNEGADLSRLMPAGTLVLVCSGLVGVPGILAVDACIHDGFLGFENISSEADKEFLYYYFCSLQERFHAAATHGGIFTNLTTSILKEFEITLPPLQEQKKIASVLQYWDHAVDLTEQLITAKQERRTWLMQQLLTGKRRLPGFSQSNKQQKNRYGSLPKDWGYPPIGKLASDVSVKNGDGVERPVLSCTKHQGLVDSLQYFSRQVFSENLSTYKIVNRGQFVYATNHIDEGSIGYQNLYDEALISPMYTVFQTNEAIDDSFLYLILKTETYRHIFAASTSASVDRRGSLRWKEFSKIHVPLPSLDEQREIVKVFEIANRELNLLQSQLEALRNQKKGLMQQLLTGKVRVKQDSNE